MATATSATTGTMVATVKRNAGKQSERIVQNAIVPNYFAHALNVSRCVKCGSDVVWYTAGSLGNNADTGKWLHDEGQKQCTTCNAANGERSGAFRVRTNIDGLTHLALGVDDVMPYTAEANANGSIDLLKLALADVRKAFAANEITADQYRDMVDALIG